MSLMGTEGADKCIHSSSLLEIERLSLIGRITIRCTRSRGPSGFFCLQDFRRGPVNVAVIGLVHISLRQRFLANP